MGARASLQCDAERLRTLKKGLGQLLQYFAKWSAVEYVFKTDSEKLCHDLCHDRCLRLIQRTHPKRIMVRRNPGRVDLLKDLYSPKLMSAPPMLVRHGRRSTGNTSATLPKNKKGCQTQLPAVATLIERGR